MREGAGDVIISIPAKPSIDLRHCTFCRRSEAKPKPAVAVIVRVLDGRPTPVCLACWRFALAEGPYQMKC